VKSPASTICLCCEAKVLLVVPPARAAAFERSLERHPELESRLRQYFGTDITESHLKMAEAPTGKSILQQLVWGGRRRVEAQL